VSAFPSDASVYPITDRKLAGNRDIEEIIGELCDGGARIIQLREKELTTAQFTALAEKATERAHRDHALLIVNDRADVALYSGADGVHLGDDEIPPSAARAVLGPERIVGVSCHSLEDVNHVLNEPIDYFAVGPVFPTDTKVLKYDIVGLELVQQARELSSLPVIAIGGITADSAPSVFDAGADAVAVIRAVMATDNISHSMKKLMHAKYN
jgi:thiamine-phosphate pyrophosphorylase